MAENTALVMGGHFQSEMLHYTKSHHELLRQESRPLLRQQYELYRDAANFPSKERPRLVHPRHSVDVMSLMVCRISLVYRQLDVACRC